MLYTGVCGVSRPSYGTLRRPSGSLGGHCMSWISGSLNYTQSLRDVGLESLGQEVGGV